MSEEYQQQKTRDAKAAALGEGSWMNKVTREWCQVEVTFYPKVTLWISEAGQRRKIDRETLEADYKQLEL